MLTAGFSIHLGLIVNPLAGIGGPAGLKGSDDSLLVARARDEGAQLRAPARAERCLQLLFQLFGENLKITTYPDEMGERVCLDCGFSPAVIGHLTQSISSAADTTHAAQDMLEQRVDLLLFVGGDGTARDICSVVGEKLPVLGIPAGVKMHSGVFATSPEAAAEVVRQMVMGELVDLDSQEVRDIDETALREGRVKSRYFGDMQIPRSGQFVQQVKQGGVEVEELVIDDIAADLIENLEDDTLYVVGAGTTTAVFMEQLGLSNTLLGVDVMCNETILANDVNAEQLESIVLQHEGAVVAILSITGGQGSLIGRGNQQLSARVLRRIGLENLWVLATKTKLKTLAGRPLLMDSNDPELDKLWHGYVKVKTGYRDTVLYPLGQALPDYSKADS